MLDPIMATLYFARNLDVLPVHEVLLFTAGFLLFPSIICLFHYYLDQTIVTNYESSLFVRPLIIMYTYDCFLLQNFILRNATGNVILWIRKISCLIGIGFSPFTLSFHNYSYLSLFVIGLLIRHFSLIDILSI